MIGKAEDTSRMGNMGIWPQCTRGIRKGGQKRPTSTSAGASSEASASTKAAALVVRTEPSKSERHDVGWTLSGVHEVIG